MLALVGGACSHQPPSRLTALNLDCSRRANAQLAVPVLAAHCDQHPAFGKRQLQQVEEAKLLFSQRLLLLRLVNLDVQLPAGSGGEVGAVAGRGIARVQHIALRMHYLLYGIWQAQPAAHGSPSPARLRRRRCH